MATPSTDQEKAKQEETKFTIQLPSKLEQRQKDKKASKDKPSKFAVGTKWMFTFVFGILLLASLTLSKISILALSEAMNNDPDLNTDSRCRLFVKLQILMLVPTILTLLKSVWAGTFRKDLPMPSFRTILCAVPVSVLESFGLCLFVFNVPGLCKTHHIVLLMNCVFLVPLFDNIILSWKQRKAEVAGDRPTLLHSFGLFGFALFLELVGVSLSVFLVCLHVTHKKLWIPIMGILCLSFAWMPSVNSFLLETRYSGETSDKNGIELDDKNPTVQNNAVCKATPIGKRPNTERITWKLTLIMSIMKICSTYGISMLLFSVDFISPFPESSKVTLSNYTNGWKLSVWEESSNEEVYYFVAQICSSFLSYYVGYMACTTCMQIGAFALPLVLTIVPSLLLLIIKESCESLLMRIRSIQDLYDCIVIPDKTKVDLAFVIVAGSSLLMAQVLFSFRVIWTNGTLFKMKEDQMFWLPTYMPVLLEQWLMLIRRNEFNDDEYKIRVRKGGRAKVIICTTMFREVKSKKRWSQVMYMSYVLDRRLKKIEATDEDVFILTTDADVKFTSDSIAYLLDLLARDDSVGAVCARTFPLGSGPIVWYQAFEYAIGHWFQKATEHVIGSVLCSPGCFSVYRCKAIREVLPIYASDVEHAFDFLTKDMGEDRWLCTLMVQTGRRIEYCAASENSTHCPETFDEFFKQRRRWVVSTLANMMLLLQQWTLVHEFNHRVSFWFLVYQAVLLFATLIGPSSVILVICGGLKYAWNWNPVLTLVLQLMICAGFTVCCLITSSKTQLTVAKILTFMYAAVMTAVTVGTALQISYDFSGLPWTEANFISHNIKISTTTVYLATLTGIFLITAVMHLQECLYLLHGIWYLMCLPAGYLLLIIYSICNITDRSWGTREDKHGSDSSTVYAKLRNQIAKKFRSIFSCCFPKHSIDVHHVETNRNGQPPQKKGEDENPGQQPTDISIQGTTLDDTAVKRDELPPNVYPIDAEITAIEERDDTNRKTQRHTAREDDAVSNDSYRVLSAKDWLPEDMGDKYGEQFINNGFENAIFISSMTDKDLRKIGVKSDGEIFRLILKIRELPEFKIAPAIPNNLSEWLDTIGLEKYKSNFIDASIKSKDVMETLKSYGKSDIKNQLKITKRGHVKRLLYAIEQMRQPTKREVKIERVRQELLEKREEDNSEDNLDQQKFWKDLVELCLVPQSSAFGSEKTLKENLNELRNSWLVIFALSNMLWLILIFTLAEKGQLLSVFGSNLVAKCHRLIKSTILAMNTSADISKFYFGFIVVVLFGFILIIQFLAMVVHRFSTLKHYLASAPYFRSSGKNVIYDLNKRNDGDIPASSPCGCCLPIYNRITQNDEENTGSGYNRMTNTE